jgi:hypothetical protein
MQAYVRAMYASCETEVIADLQKRLKYFGYTTTKE